MIPILKDWFTQRDNISYSLTKLIGISAFISATYKFCESASPDFVGYATLTSGIMAALAVKYYAEGVADK